MPLHILCISWGTSGNLSPMLTAGRQLRRAGHHVRVMADPAMRGEVEGAGFPFITWRRAPTGCKADPTDHSDMRDWNRRAIFAPAAAYAADTFDEIRRSRTDAVLGLDILFGCALGAEAAGVPYAMLSPHVSIRPVPGIPPTSSGLNPPTSPEEHAQVAAAAERIVTLMDGFLPLLNRARAGLGLRPLARTFDLYDRVDRVFLAISAAFDFEATALPWNYRYVGPLLDEPVWSKSELPAWPATKRPRVLIACSTGAQNQTELIQRIVRAVGSVDVEAVVTAGLKVRLEDLPATENVRVVPAAPHDSVMDQVSLVVSQGGHGTVSRALLHGLPLLVIPIGRDQGDNAARVQVRGAGLSLPPTALEAEIADAVRWLLAEPRFRAAATRLGAAMRADMDAAGLVPEIEAMAVAPYAPTRAQARERTPA
ncbi:4'-demethylrebeccamycin synthase [Methylobacterium crusticola]|uniref:4'-demethylrebeccamycin synthase n=2 Tax=Methylobacterium crusticola TaxID=1697972 RepID=A0ABQ4R1F8_9HYPH|nr:4'-demethylrebeccamycin synthase [Methylobacterium crusticola]